MSLRVVKTLSIVGAVLALAAVPAWRTRSASAKLRASTSVFTQTSGQWTPVGLPFKSSTNVTGPYNSGRVASIAVDPRDASRWLAGVGNGGVWETRNAGESWTPIADDAPTLSIGAVAFAASNPDIIYVATGENTGSSVVPHVGVGILKSVNGGQTWTLLGQSNFARASVRRLRVNPSDANMVLAASARGFSGRDSRDAPSPPPLGIVRSTDGGLNWTQTLGGQATALEVDRADFSRQYAAIADQTLPGTVPPGTSPNGIYRSTNAGVTWSRIEGPWGSEPSVPNRSAVGRIELALAPSDPNVLYASIQIPPNGGSTGNGLLGLFRTDNAWADPPNWIQVSTQATGPSGYCGSSFLSKCGYSHVITVDPRDANTFYGGGERDLWRCTNCSASPTWRASFRTHADFHVLVWAGNRLIAGNDGGVFSTVDQGATWQAHNQSLLTNMFYMGALHPTDPDFILGGPRDSTVVAYRPSTGWLSLPQSATDEWGEGEVAISASHPNTDWMATHTSAVTHRTTDGGRTTLQVDGGIDKTGAAFIAPVRKCPANDDVFLAGTTRIWRTNNFFNSAMPTWTSNGPNEVSSVLAITFVEGDRNCNTYAYGTRFGAIRLTRDGGTTWTDLDPTRTLPLRPFNSIAFDPTNPNRAYLVVSSYDVATPTKPGHIFRTDNAMSASPTWTRVGPPDQPFADMPFNIIAIDPRNTQLVYAGSDNGLWQSNDGGTSWTKLGLGRGLPPASVNDIQINPTTNKTVIFTYGRGAYELVR